MKLFIRISIYKYIVFCMTYYKFLRTHAEHILLVQYIFNEHNLKGFVYYIAVFNLICEHIASTFVYTFTFIKT